MAPVRIVLRLSTDVAGLVVLSLRPRRSVKAENLFLRRQLALYRERGVRPRRVDAATRVSLALLFRLIDWRDAMVVVRSVTLIHWHRAGWRLFWRVKSRPGRPPGRPRGDRPTALRIRGHRAWQPVTDSRSGQHLREKSGLFDTAIGVAPAIDPEIMGGSLRPRTSAHGARSRRARPPPRGSCRLRYNLPAIESASASTCAPDRCWVA
jgi:hypothetical protein